jgi:hypothetical protein
MIFSVYQLNITQNVILIQLEGIFFKESDIIEHKRITLQNFFLDYNKEKIHLGLGKQNQNL